MTKNTRQRNILFLPFAFQHDFHLGVAQYAGRHGWHLNADMASTGKIPYGWHGDGIVTLLTEDDTAERIVMQYGVPVVDLTVNRPDLNVARVNKDNVKIGELGARHFLEQGWHSFVFFSRMNSNVCRLRAQGYRQEIERYGHRCTELIWPVRNPGLDAHWDLVCDWLARELAGLPRPLALMAYNDYDAALAMDVCLAAGYPVPEDAGILGVDDMEEVCNCRPVPMSSVKTGAQAIGYRASSLLDQLIDGARIPASPILIPPIGISQRKSSQRLVIRSERLRCAIEAIDARIDTPLAMERIAEAAGITRQKLYALFERELHQTPVEYIQRKRIKIAKELLLNSEEGVGEIALRCGMPVLSTFIRQFTHDTGATPGHWRREVRKNANM